MDYIDEIRQRNVETAKKAMADVIDADCPLDSIYAKNCKFYQPFFFPGRITPINPETDGEIISHEDTVSIFHSWQYDPDSERIYTTQDPDTVIVTNSGKGTVMRADGRDYDYVNSYVHVFKFTDGLISEYYEYANPLNLMDAFGMEHPDLPTPEETDKLYEEKGIM